MKFCQMPIFMACELFLEAVFSDLFHVGAIVGLIAISHYGHSFLEIRDLARKINRIERIKNKNSSF